MMSLDLKLLDEHIPIVIAVVTLLTALLLCWLIILDKKKCQGKEKNGLKRTMSFSSAIMLESAFPDEAKMIEPIINGVVFTDKTPSWAALHELTKIFATFLRLRSCPVKYKDGAYGWKELEMNAEDYFHFHEADSIDGLLEIVEDIKANPIVHKNAPTTGKRGGDRTVNSGSGQQGCQYLTDPSSPPHALWECHVIHNKEAGQQVGGTRTQEEEAEKGPSTGTSPSPRLLSVSPYRGCSAIVTRIHHTVGDGISMAAVMAALFRDKDGNPLPPPKPFKPARKRNTGAGAGRGARVAKNRSLFSGLGRPIGLYWRGMVGLVEVLTLPNTRRDGSNAFCSFNRAKLVYNHRRRVVYFPPIPLEFIKEIKEGATSCLLAKQGQKLQRQEQGQSPRPADGSSTSSTSSTSSSSSSSSSSNHKNNSGGSDGDGTDTSSGSESSSESTPLRTAQARANAGGKVGAGAGAGTRAKVTINDVLMSATAGCIRRYIYHASTTKHTNGGGGQQPTRLAQPQAQAQSQTKTQAQSQAQARQNYSSDLATLQQFRALLPLALPRTTPPSPPSGDKAKSNAQLSDFPDNSDVSDSLRNLWSFVSVKMATSVPLLVEIEEKGERKGEKGEKGGKKSSSSSSSGEDGDGVGALARLLASNQELTSIKRSPKALIASWLQNCVMPNLPSFVCKQTAYDLFRGHSLVFSNVPGPPQQVTLGGCKVVGLQMVFPNFIPQVGILSYNEQVYMNMVVDPVSTGAGAGAGAGEKDGGGEEDGKEGENKGKGKGKGKSSLSSPMQLLPYFFIEELVELANQISALNQDAGGSSSGGTASGGSIQIPTDLVQYLAAKMK